MKKHFVLFGLLFLMLVSLSHWALAEVVQGTLKSVDSDTKKIEIDTEKGLQSVAYTSSTKWPVGINEPSQLLGKKVKVDEDDLLEEALTVEEL